MSAVVGAAPIPARRDPPATRLSGLIVRPTLGPAWWRANRGQSTVWILGVPPDLPRRFRWDQRSLKRHLTGAAQVITPAMVSVDLLALQPLAEQLESAILQEKPEDSIPAELRTRFIADAKALGHEPARYDHWNDLAAGVLMMMDFRARMKLDSAEPMATIDRAARAHHLHPLSAGTYSVSTVFKAGTPGPTVRLDHSCLAMALNDIEGSRQNELSAARGWARGDVRVALTASPGPDGCVAFLPGGQDVPRQIIADETSAVTLALNQPGKSVAILPLRHLVGPDGVLQQLTAAGFEIRGP